LGARGGGLSGPDDQRDYEFACLMDVDPDLQAEFAVTARTLVENSRRVEVQVARFPRAAVLDIWTASPTPPMQNDVV
jgi:hypothetical protein